MELAGQTWYSKIGSYMTIESDGGDGFTGTYHTAPGGMSAKLVGLLGTPGGAFGWTVCWPKGNYPASSSTSWAADIMIIDGVPTILSSWIIREPLANNSYYSTVCGCEEYTQVKPTPETIEAHKLKRHPHPL